MIYLDTSAFLKLVRAEAESAALTEFLTKRPGVPLVSSVLLVVEARRASQRGAPELLPRTDVLLSRVGQIGIGAAVVEAAGRLPGATLRSLDAIHVATALLVKDELEALLTYDVRLAEVAEREGLVVAAPSA